MMKVKAGKWLAPGRKKIKGVLSYSPSITSSHLLLNSTHTALTTHHLFHPFSLCIDGFSPQSSLLIVNIASRRFSLWIFFKWTRCNHIRSLKHCSTCKFQTQYPNGIGYLHIMHINEYIGQISLLLVLCPNMLHSTFCKRISFFLMIGFNKTALLKCDYVFFLFLSLWISKTKEIKKYICLLL
jgi:hypothetical protein